MYVTGKNVSTVASIALRTKLVLVYMIGTTALVTGLGIYFSIAM